MIQIVGGALLAGVGQYFISQVGNIIGGTISTAMQPKQLAESYGVWSTLPIRLPEPQVLFQLFLAKRITIEELVRYLAAHGIDFKSETRHGQLWRKVFELSLPRPGVAELLDATVRGCITPEESESEARRLGLQAKDWDYVLRNLQNHLGVEEALAAWRRGLITEKQLSWFFQRNKVLDETEQKIIKDMSNQVPGASDLISLVVREAFNEKQVKILGLDDEYEENPDFAFWANTQGLGVAKAKDENGKERSFDFAKGYWRAHWQLPSPGQAYEFLHRLRPERIDYYRKNLPGELAEQLQPFTANDLSALLKASDYAKKWRAPLAAISYTPYRLVDLRRLYTTGIIKKEDVVSELQDVGNTEDHAKTLADWFELEKDKDEITSHREIGKSTVLESFELGVLSEEQAAIYLYPILQKNLAKLKEFYAAGETEQLKIAMSYPGVQYVLKSKELKRTNKLVQQTISSLSNRVLQGIITLADFEVEVSTLPISKEKIDYELTKLKIRLASPRKAATVAMLIKWCISGIITTEDLSERLVNLGYSLEDVSLIMSDTKLQKQKLSERQNKLKDKEEKASKKSGAKQKEEEDAEVAGKAPISELKKWYKDGMLNEEEARKRLKARHWSDWEIELWLKSNR